MKIAKERIAVLVGKSGETKKEIEQSLGVKIDLNSKTGECDIVGDFSSPKYNPLNVLIAQKIVTAIGRGFNPIKAMKLLGDTYDMEFFNLVSIVGKSDKAIKRINGRVIGRNGEMRRAIEHFTESFLSVYGKTISIISNYDNLEISRKAVSMLINGIPHNNVIKFLESKYSEKKKEEFRKMYKPEF
jgi:ribosomal RNA assembly protein